MANHLKNAGAGARRQFKHRPQGSKAGYVGVSSRRKRQRVISPEPTADALKVSFAEVVRLAYAEMKPNTGRYTRLLLAYLVMTECEITVTAPESQEPPR